MRMSPALEEIKRLDPERDHQRIAFLDACWEFPWDTTRSLELALFRTYCVPRGTEILAGTGEFLKHAQKRYDDTVLILAEMLENGYDSERGRAAQRIMNRLHGLYPIHPDDYLYTLSRFIFEPISWNARFGWRPLVEQERLASYFYWREVGRRMNIKNIPPTIEAFEAWALAYERAEFRYGDTNRLVGDATIKVFEDWFPAPMRGLVRRGIYALLDDHVLDAFGYPHPSPLERRLVEGALKARAAALRGFPPRRHPRLITQSRHRSYPRGHQVEQLGAAAAHQPRPRAVEARGP